MVNIFSLEKTIWALFEDNKRKKGLWELVIYS